MFLSLFLLFSILFLSLLHTAFHYQTQLYSLALYYLFHSYTRTHTLTQLWKPYLTFSLSYHHYQMGGFIIFFRTESLKRISEWLSDTNEFWLMNISTLLLLKKIFGKNVKILWSNFENKIHIFWKYNMPKYYSWNFKLLHNYFFWLKLK